MSDRDAIDQAVELAADLCRRFEGLRLQPYLCPAGVPTIGYGSTRYADGRAVTLLDAPITRQQADELLRMTLRRDYLPGVLSASPGLIKHPAALAAMVDFAYNLGIARYASSTLRQRVNAQDWPRAADELRRWTRASGRVLLGLVKRREAELAMLAQSA